MKRKQPGPVMYVLCYQGPEEPENQTTLLWASDDVDLLKQAATEHIARHEEGARLTWKKYAGGKLEGRIRVRGIVGAMIDFYDIQPVPRL